MSDLEPQSQAALTAHEDALLGLSPAVPVPPPAPVASTSDLSITRGLIRTAPRVAPAER